MKVFAVGTKFHKVNLSVPGCINVLVNVTEQIETQLYVVTLDYSHLYVFASDVKVL